MQAVEDEDLEQEITHNDSRLTIISKMADMLLQIKASRLTINSIAIILELKPSLPFAIRLISQPFPQTMAVDRHS